MNIIIVFARYPEPGKVKTRLASQIGDKLAAELYRRFIEMTVLTVKASRITRFCCAVTPDSPPHTFKDELLPADWQLFVQKGKDLGSRIIHAFRYGFQDGASKVIIIGSDSPTLPASYLNSAVQSLSRSDMVIGPALDGGYYLIGLKKLQEALFKNIDWSTDMVFDQTLEAAKNLCLDVDLLPEWYDVDDQAFLERAVQDDKSGTLAACLQDLS